MRVAGVMEQRVERSSSLQRHTTWLAAGNIVYAASQWGLLMATAKIGSPTLVGRLALGFAVAVPITVVTGLQLRNMQATDAKGTMQFQHVLALRLVTALVGLVVITLLALLGPWNSATAVVVVLIGLAKTIDGISEVCYGGLQRDERHEIVARSMLLRAPLGAAAFALALAITGSLEIAAMGLLVISALVLGAHDLPSIAASLGDRRALVPHWHRETIGQLARLALPLGVASMLVALMPYIPRYALSQQMGEHEVGVFAALASLVGVGTTLVSALGQAAAPRLAQAHAARNHQAFVQLTLRLLGVGALLGAAMLTVVGIVGGPVLTIFYTAEYAHYNDVFLLLSASGAVGYVASFLGYANTAGLSFRPQVPIFLVVVVVMALGCQMLVPIHGLAGAAWAVFGATVVQLVGLGWLWMRVTASARAQEQVA